MGQRGRRSTNHTDLAAVLLSAEAMQQRPPPPAELGPEAAAEWVAITATRPPHYFATTEPMLAALCNAIVDARRVAMLIEQTVKAKRLDLDVYAKLLAAQARQSGLISILCTRMRLSQQTTIRGERARPRIAASKPWHAG